MQIICSPRGIVDVERPGQGINDIKKAGFENIVLDADMGANAGTLESLGKSSYKSNKYTIAVDDPKRLEERLSPFVERSRRENISFQIAQAPYLLRNTKHTDLNDKVKSLVMETIKLCGKVGCKYLIVRPVFAGVPTAELWNVNREFYLSLAGPAKENNVMILLENQCKDVNGHLVRGICADEVEAVNWVDKLNEAVNEERFGFCMNVGTCNICGQNMYDFAVTIGSRIKAVVLRDCNGEKENSLLPFTSVNQFASQTDWLNLIRGLRKIEYAGMLVFDFGDTAGCFSPILKPQLMSLAKATADYFKWQIEMEGLLKKYDSRVLFGAGNMCQNYMKNYGEAFPPMFTCDNNSALWGQEFHGLEIKSPESLKELPKETAIFICNIYYREIEVQLREMGITNPIEFFNDEYMPTYYFKRLERDDKK